MMNAKQVSNGFLQFHIDTLIKTMATTPHYLYGFLKPYHIYSGKVYCALLKAKVLLYFQKKIDPVFSENSRKCPELFLLGYIRGIQHHRVSSRFTTTMSKVKLT